MRYNIFNRAHLPLKTALLTGCISLDKMREQQACKLSETLEKVEEVLRIYEEQISYEALHILPYIFEYEPSIWNNYTGEYANLTRLSKDLRDLVQSYYRQKKTEDKLKIMKRINESYNEFMLSNYNHMDDEEAVLNEILWRHYQDNVLMQIEEKMDILPHLVKQPQRTGFQIATAA